MRDRSAKAGFTMIEVLVAMVVLSIAIAGMIPSLIQSTRGNFYGNQTTRAAAACQDKLEEFRPMDFTDSNLVNGSDEVDDGTSQRLARSWTVAEDSSHDLKGIEVTTTWTDGQRIAHAAKAFMVKVRY